MRHTFRYIVATTPTADQQLALSDDDTHHLARVVRRRPDDDAELIDAQGRRRGAAGAPSW